MMTLKNKNIYWIIAGIISSFTALIHTLVGQLDLVNPLLESNLSRQAKTEWLGVWHIVTAVLIITSYYLLRYGFNTTQKKNSDVIQLIGILYILFSIVFIGSSLLMQVFAPQWILLLPIGVLSLIRKSK